MHTKTVTEFECSFKKGARSFPLGIAAPLSEYYKHLLSRGDMFNRAAKQHLYECLFALLFKRSLQSEARICSIVSFSVSVVEI